jgi:hypothetical protein
MKAYWVKINGTGQLVLSAGGPQKTANTSERLASFNTLRLESADGSEQKLYFAEQNANDSIDIQMYELPPPPPDGVVDARFTTGRLLETVDAKQTEEIPISFTSLQYPVSVKCFWNRNNHPRVSLKVDGQEMSLMNGQECTLKNQPMSLALVLSGSQLIPREYSLSQNYPNPFNPVTRIEYGLPVDGRVRLTIYNLLGQAVKTLIDRKESAGIKSVEWDGTDDSGNVLPSGVYFYRIESTADADAKNTFTRVKKMIMIR